MLSADTIDRPLFEDGLTIDADVHVSYTEPEVGGEAAKAMEWPYDILLDPAENRGIRTGPSTGHYGQTRGRLEPHSDRVVDPGEDIVAPLMDGLGVDHPILNVLGRYDMFPEKDMIVDWNRALNDVIVEQFLDMNDDFFGLISLQTRFPDRAVEELDRMGDEKQVVGVILHAGGQWTGLGDEQFDRIWAAAEDNDLSVAFNGSFSGYMLQMPDIFRGMRKKTEINALQHPWAMMWTMASLIGRATPAKFPDLNFVFLDAGISWVPYMIARLNREYSTWRSQVPLLDDMPEEYIREQFYFGTQPLHEFEDPSHLEPFIDLVGIDRLLFSTNHPYSDIADVEHARETFAKMSAGERKQVFGQNAVDAFGLPI